MRRRRYTLPVELEPVTLYDAQGVPRAVVDPLDKGGALSNAQREVLAAGYARFLAQRDGVDLSRATCFTVEWEDTGGQCVRPGCDHRWMCKRSPRRKAFVTAVEFHDGYRGGGLWSGDAKEWRSKGVVARVVIPDPDPAILTCVQVAA